MKLFLIGIPIMVALTLWDTFALTKLWLWYAVPRGLPAVSFAEMTAAMLLYVVLRNGRQLRAEPQDGRSDDERAYAFLSVLGIPGIALLLGWWLR